MPRWPMVGELKRPFIVERHLDADGNTTWEAEPHTVRRVFDEDTAQKFDSSFRIGYWAGRNGSTRGRKGIAYCRLKRVRP